MRHPRYCLTHHPGISSNINNATHFSTPPTQPTLAHHPLYPLWLTTHASHAGTSPQNGAHGTHASTSPTLVRHPRQHAINTNTLPTLAHLPRHPRQHKQHAISQTLGYPIKLLSYQLSNSKRKFSSFYFQFLFLQPLLVRHF